MTFITYAQNFEDVLLWRALGHVRNGFYIDVGANDPEEHSVTKAFYDAGWRGINIEPLPMYADAFRSQRKRDINLAIAAGSSAGSLTLYDVESIPGWASPDAAVADMHRKDGHQVSELTVPVRTLASVCEEHARGDIHFLKVDVEGHEAEVLRGMDFKRFRPWIVVVEATLPGSRDSAHAAWESLVAGQHYSFVYFDGLNRYYVADEHPELKQAFGTQPNVFDDFIPHQLDKAWKTIERSHGETVDAHRRLGEAIQARDQSHALAHEALAQSRELLARDQQLREEMGQLREHQLQLLEQVNALSVQAANDAHTIASQQQQLAASYASGQQVQAWARDLEQRLIATHQSTSWRVTAPLRRLGAILRRLRTSQPRALLRRAVERATNNERLRRLVIPVLRRFPGLRTQVSKVLGAIKQQPELSDAAVLAPDLPELPAEIKALPASARRVATDLQAALGARHGNG